MGVCVYGCVPILSVDRGEEGGSDEAMAVTVHELMPQDSRDRWRRSTTKQQRGDRNVNIGIM